MIKITTSSPHSHNRSTGKKKDPLTPLQGGSQPYSTEEETKFHRSRLIFSWTPNYLALTRVKIQVLTCSCTLQHGQPAIFLYCFFRFTCEGTKFRI